MLARTEGIVLHTLKYTDNSVIAKIFTRDYGTTSFMVKGMHGKRSGMRPAYFLPLSVLDIDMYRQENKSLQILKEIRVQAFSQHIQADVIKSSVALFISEVLYKTLSDGYINNSLFEFLKEKISSLALETTPGAVFPIMFLLELSREFGIAPMNNRDARHTVFSISEGRYIAAPLRPDPSFHLSGEAGALLHTLMENAPVSAPGEVRAELLSDLIRYFQYHLPGMGNIRSQQVLREVFHF